MLIALTSLAFEIAAERARCLILKTEHELSVVGDASDKIGVAYFLIGRWEPSSDLSFFTTSRSTPHPLRVLAGLSPRQQSWTKLAKSLGDLRSSTPLSSEQFLAPGYPTSSSTRLMSLRS